MTEDDFSLSPPHKMVYKQLRVARSHNTLQDESHFWGIKESE